MKEPSPKRRGGLRLTRPQSATRKLSWISRLRARVRRGADQVLAADAAWSVIFVVAVMLVLGSQRCGNVTPQYSIGQVASERIVAPRDFDVPDRAMTEQRRRAAREAVPQFYLHDSERGAKLVRGLASLFEEGRRVMEQADPQERAAALSEMLGDRLADEVGQTLVRQQFDEGVEQSLTSALGRAMQGLVVGNKTLLAREPVIVLQHVPSRREERVADYRGFTDVGEVRQALRESLAETLDLPSADEQVLAELAATFVDANVQLDSETTQARREAAAESVPPVLMRVQRGHVLVEEGERFTRETMEALIAARGLGTEGFDYPAFLGLLFVTCVLAFFLYRYCLFHQRAFRRLPQLHALLVLMLVSMLFLARGMLWLASLVVDTFTAPFDNLASYTYLIPLGAGAILVALLSNGRIATIYSMFAALLFGAFSGEDFYLILWAMIVQLSGVYAISTYRERAALLRAGFVVGGAGAITTIALEALRGGTGALSVTLYGATLAMIGGAVGVGLLISFSLPLLEGVFGVLTDIRLLELSNVNNPLLSQLAVKAPGSYNHSLVVGTLAEEAARAIGANSLFCRVAAFYHDIGKVNHPEYYVENQRGINPHDRLTPSMSALIIASHVKDGVKLAREARLPEQIVDIIPQHHGTKLMTYFFEKAKSSTDPSLGPVKEEDFRYPGPKPQTREAAIFMLADAVEAAARTVDEPSPNRLREMIRKVCSAIVVDGQLDSCELTFADLERIQEAFLRYLVSMHHQRVDYPGFDFRLARGESKNSDDGGARKLAGGT